ncbi:ABC transporter permease [Marinigracilibium pacificum]|uniref:FtsX-like permease family protein n=1 Tax=Marinigracilibium pacificum TaxID=2729599 RepID=A0A848IX32_9BACT|nr:FtsX-like permease family protein [Marinigracilibium pacificum]NMM48216.1 FtsX-like permease family protein [Marinigracilibium pacificum]
MIRFILKGIIRDRSRSLLPIIVVTIGVAITVLLSGYINGVMNDFIEQNARFETGHLKVVTRPYLENIDQIPNDLAIMDSDSVLKALKTNYKDVEWVERIKFGGLIDIPDSSGETRAQGPAAGMAINLINETASINGDIERLNLKPALVEGRFPQNYGEVLLSRELMSKTDVKIGDQVTFIGSTMFGSMALMNYKVVGSINFGIQAMDRGLIIMDIVDARSLLDMENATSEILGYFHSGYYDDERSEKLSLLYNSSIDPNNEFAPVIIPLKDQNELSGMLEYVNVYTVIFISIFILAMSIVLWNTGLLGGLRRYREYGIRLALGESKTKIYKTTILESLIIGLIGSISGTLLGLAGVWYLQTYGIDISDMMSNNAMIMSSVIRARVSSFLFVIGFIPGVIATLSGSLLSGVGIFKRQTADLFKELEL